MARTSANPSISPPIMAPTTLPSPPMTRFQVSLAAVLLLAGGCVSAQTLAVRTLALREGEMPAVTEEKVASLGITEQLVEAETAPNMTYQEALVFAMKAEKAAFTLYTKLAEMTSDDSLQRVFKSLAQEEAKHKLRFEIEYDDHVLDGV